MRDDIMLIIVDRFIDDPGFRESVTADARIALAEYDLTAEELGVITDFYAQLGNPSEGEVTTALTTIRRQGAL